MDWQLFFEREEAEEFSWELIEEGAMGVEILAENSLRAFFQGDEAGKQAFVTRATELGFSFRSEEEIPDTNWVQQCEELMERNQIGQLTIVPVSGPDQLPQRDSKNHFFLIPGAGFGTGHHVSTEMALLHLQESFFAQSPPKRIFDLGTGSGILSVVAAELFGADVDAVDIDSAALVNAQDNAQINGVRDRINFSLGSMERASGVYDLILANIYAEILCSYEAQFLQSLKVGGRIILSGVMESLIPLVEQHFAEPRWRRLSVREELSWYAAVFEKI